MDLKELLFATCEMHHKKSLRTEETYGKHFRLSCVYHAKYVAIYTLIEEAGLIEEYREWRKKNERNSNY